MPTLKTAAVVVACIVAVAVMFSRTRERKKAVRETVEAVLLAKHRGSAAAPATSWTEEARQQLDREMPKDMAPSDVPFFSGDDDRQWYRRCMMEKTIAAFPGGPAEMLRVAQDGKRMNEVAYENGFACAREFSEGVAAAPWGPKFAPVFVYGCVRDEGEKMRAACSCLAEKARATYATPAEFVKVMNTKREARGRSEQTKYQKLITSCLKYAPAD